MLVPPLEHQALVGQALADVQSGAELRVLGQRLGAGPVAEAVDRAPADQRLAGLGVDRDGVQAEVEQRPDLEPLGDGPFLASDDDVEKLGRNVAYWSLGAGARFVPAGIVEIYDVP